VSNHDPYSDRQLSDSSATALTRWRLGLGSRRERSFGVVLRVSD